MQKITTTPARFWGERIIDVDSLPSTSTLAKDMALRGEGSGTIIRAGEQTEGRGRLERGWLSPRGGLWFSLIIRPAPRERSGGGPVIDISQLAGTTLLFSLWVMQFLEDRTSLPFQLHWPNDIYREGKKAGGILLESSSAGSRVEWIVAGVGINVNNPMASASTDGQATSLIEETGEEAQIEPLFMDLLAFLEAQFLVFLEKGFTFFHHEAAGHCPMAGRKVQVIDHRGTRTVKVLDIGEKGQLMVVNDKGIREDLWSVNHVTLL
jgi:BirA family transcriptional regulator, biotin operon repressor / biotin---[acetyl-CoA-carboxylase] ligase